MIKKIALLTVLSIPSIVIFVLVFLLSRIAIACNYGQKALLTVSQGLTDIVQKHKL